MRHTLLLSILPAAALTAAAATSTSQKESCRQALVAMTNSCSSLDESCLCPVYDEAAEIMTSCAVSRSFTIEEASEELLWLAKHCGRTYDLDAAEPGLRKRGLRRSVGSFFSNIGSMLGFNQPAATTSLDDGSDGEPDRTVDTPVFASTPAVVTTVPRAQTTAQVTVTRSASVTATRVPASTSVRTASSEIARTRTPTITSTITPSSIATPTISPNTPTESAIVTPSVGSSIVSQSSGTAASASQQASATAAPDASKSSKKLPGAAVAAIVIVSLLAFGGILWLAFMCYRRRQRDRLQEEQIAADLQNDHLLYPEPKLPTVYSSGTASFDSATGVGGGATAAGAVAGVGGAAAVGAASRHAHHHSADSADSVPEMREPPVRQSFEAGPDSQYDYRRSRGSFPGGAGPAPMGMAMNNPSRPPPSAWGQDGRNLHHLNYSQQGDGYGGAYGPSRGGPYPQPGPANRPPYPPGPNGGSYVPYRPPQGYGPNRRSMGPGPGGPGVPLPRQSHRPVPPLARPGAPGGLSRQLPAALMVGSQSQSQSQSQPQPTPTVAAASVAPPQIPPQSPARQSKAIEQPPKVQPDPLLTDTEDHSDSSTNSKKVLKVINGSSTPGSSPAIGSTTADTPSTGSVATVIKASTPTVVTVTRSASTRSTASHSPPLGSGKSNKASIPGIRRKEVGSPKSPIPE